VWKLQSSLAKHVVEGANRVAGGANGDSDLKTPHFFLELLQNADDAGANAVGFVRKSKDTVLEVVNNGAAFSFTNLVAISSIHCSSKSGAENVTGEKGIGFRSLLLRTNFVTICSGGFKFKLLGAVNIESMLPKWEESLTVEQDAAVKPGWTTKIVASGIKVPLAPSIGVYQIIGVDDIRFLRHVRRVSLSFPLGPVSTVLSSAADSEKIGVKHLAVGGATVEKIVFSNSGRNEGCTRFTFMRDASRVARSGSARDKTDISFDFPDNFVDTCRLYAFLPFGTQRLFSRVHVNADFLADPGREKVADSMDALEWNQFLLQQIPGLLVRCFEMCDPHFRLKFLCYLPTESRMSVAVGGGVYKEMAVLVKEAFQGVDCIQLGDETWTSPFELALSGKQLVVLANNCEQAVLSPFRGGLAKFVFPDSHMEKYGQVLESLRFIAGAKPVSAVIGDLVLRICRSDASLRAVDGWYESFLELLSMPALPALNWTSMRKLNILKTVDGRFVPADKNVVFDETMFDVFSMVILDLSLGVPVEGSTAWCTLTQSLLKGSDQWLSFLKDERVLSSANETFWKMHRDVCSLSAKELLGWLRDTIKQIPTIERREAVLAEFYKLVSVHRKPSDFSGEAIFCFGGQWIHSPHYCAEIRWAQWLDALKLRSADFFVLNNELHLLFASSWRQMGLRELGKDALIGEIVKSLNSATIEVDRHVLMVHALAMLDAPISVAENLKFYCVDLGEERRKWEERIEKSRILSTEGVRAGVLLDDVARKQAFLIDETLYKSKDANGVTCAAWLCKVFSNWQGNILGLIAKCRFLNDDALTLAEKIPDLRDALSRASKLLHSYQIMNMSGQPVRCCDLFSDAVLKYFDGGPEVRALEPFQRRTSSRKLTPQLSESLGLKQHFTVADFVSLMEESQQVVSPEGYWTIYSFLMKRLRHWMTERELETSAPLPPRTAAKVKNSAGGTYSEAWAALQTAAIFLCADGEWRCGRDVAWGLDDDAKRVVDENHHFRLDEFWKANCIAGDDFNIGQFLAHYFSNTGGMTDTKWNVVFQEYVAQGKTIDISRWWQVVRRFSGGYRVKNFLCPVGAGPGADTMWVDPLSRECYFPNDPSLVHLLDPGLIVRLPEYVEGEVDIPKIKDVFRNNGCRILGEKVLRTLFSHIKAEEPERSRFTQLWDVLKPKIVLCLVTGDLVGEAGRALYAYEDDVGKIQPLLCVSIEVAFGVGDSRITQEENLFVDGYVVYVKNVAELRKGVLRCLASNHPKWNLEKLKTMLWVCLTSDGGQVLSADQVAARADEFGRENGFVSSKHAASATKSTSRIGVTGSGLEEPIQEPFLLRRGKGGSPLARPAAQGLSRGGSRGGVMPSSGVQSDSEGQDGDDSVQEDEDEDLPMKECAAVRSLSNIRTGSRAKADSNRAKGESDGSDPQTAKSDGNNNNTGEAEPDAAASRRGAADSNPHEFLSEPAKIGREAEEIVFQQLQKQPWEKLSKILGVKVIGTERVRGSQEFLFTTEGGRKWRCIWCQATADIQIHLDGSKEPAFYLEVKGSEANKAFHLTPYQWALAELKKEKFFLIYLPWLKPSKMIIIRNFYAYVMTNRVVVGDQIECVQIGVTHHVVADNCPIWIDGTAGASLPNQKGE
jgi:hypothetical protein